ncbi:hypothetical protein IPF37_03165 [bacterium]|nr:MAG: hypothetical protein IPF37_03165 [bacterium]
MNYKKYLSSILFGLLVGSFTPTQTITAAAHAAQKQYPIIQKTPTDQAFEDGDIDSLVELLGNLDINKTMFHLRMKYQIPGRELDAHAIKEIESIIGYTFKKKSRLIQALTSELKNPEKNYEAFEFVGDAILEKIIAEMLLTSYENPTPAQLTQMRCALVSQEPIAALCVKLGLHDYVQDTKSVIPISTLCDIIESLICALYKDGGPETAQNFVLRFFLPMIKDRCPAMMDRIIQQAKKELDIDVSYEHSSHYLRDVQPAPKGVLPQIGQRQSKSKKDTKEDPMRLACYLAEKEFIETSLPSEYQKKLVRLATDPDYQPAENVLSLNVSSWQEGIQRNAREKLHTLTQILGSPQPVYYTYAAPDRPGFCCKVEIEQKSIYSRHLYPHFLAAAHCIKKTRAEEKAAQMAYSVLQENIILPTSDAISSTCLIFPTEDAGTLDLEDPITSLNLFCQKHKLTIPAYESFVKEKEDQQVFYTQVNAPWLFSALKGSSAPTEKQARAEAARRVIILIKHLANHLISPKLLYHINELKKTKSNKKGLLLHYCRCLAMQEPCIQTSICSGSVAAGLKYKTTITLANQTFGNKDFSGCKKSSKAESEEDASEIALYYLTNKLLKRELTRSVA